LERGRETRTMMKLPEAGLHLRSTLQVGPPRMRPLLRLLLEMAMATEMATRMAMATKTAYL
jgi:hypothetical protein